MLMISANPEVHAALDRARKAHRADAVSVWNWLLGARTSR